MKQLKRNVSVLVKFFIKSNAQANNITHIHLAKNKHMMVGLVYVLRRINHTPIPKIQL